MKTKLVLLLLVLLPIFGLHAQSKHSVYVNTGYTFNSSILLNEEEVENSNGFVLNVGALFQVFKFKNWSTEIGFGGKSIFSYGKVNNIRFDSRTLRFAIPGKIKYRTSDEKWGFAGGLAFQNNVDISRIDFKLRDKYSWRYNMLFELQYLMLEKFYLATGFSYNLGDMPDAFLVNDPKYSMMIGVIKPINLSRNKK